MDKLKELTIERLNKLANPQKQMAFAYSACYRMFPNYQHFYRTQMWGDEYCLIEALEIIQKFILAEMVEFDKAKLLSAIDNNTPNSDNFSNAFSTYAQEAALATYYTVNNLLNVNVEELSWPLVISRDTVDGYIINIEGYKYDEEFESKVNNHWMMQREILKQESDFAYLDEVKNVTHESLEILTSFNGGKSNIDVLRMYG